MRAARIEDHDVLIVRVPGGDVHVYQGVCPHQDQQLADGDFDGSFITCFGHLWQFDARTGRGVNPADCALARYPTKVIDGHLRVCTDGVRPNHSF